MNCLSFALKVWSRNNDYKIWYNTNHCINIPNDVVNPFPNKEFLPAEDFGYDYFSSAFSKVINEEDLLRLKKYFNK